MRQDKASPALSGARAGLKHLRRASPWTRSLAPVEVSDRVTPSKQGPARAWGSWLVPSRQLRRGCRCCLRKSSSYGWEAAGEPSGWAGRVLRPGSGQLGAEFRLLRSAWIFLFLQLPGGSWHISGGVCPGDRAQPSFRGWVWEHPCLCWGDLVRTWLLLSPPFSRLFSDEMSTAPGPRPKCPAGLRPRPRASTAAARCPRHSWLSVCLSSGRLLHPYRDGAHSHACEAPSPPRAPLPPEAPHYLPGALIISPGSDPPHPGRLPRTSLPPSFPVLLTPLS